MRGSDDAPSEPARDMGSALHQREDAPAEILLHVTRVAGGLGGELGPNLRRQFVVRVLVEPAGHSEPLRCGVAVSVLLVGEHHLHDVVPEFAELLDQPRQRPEVATRVAWQATAVSLSGGITRQ